MTDTTTASGGGLSDHDPFAMARYSEDDYSAEGAAAVEFEPIDTAAFVDCLSQPEWGKFVSWLGINLRIAMALAGKTKAEVVQMARNITAEEGGEELLFETLDQLDEARKKLEALAKLAGAGCCRLLVGISVVAVEQEPG